jgi:CheY-like chemotaxis protein
LRVVGLAPDQGEIRLLVVDDSSTNRELLRGLLEPIGFIVDEATGGDEAVEKVTSNQPGIILMDLVMPGIDGAETTKMLRAGHQSNPLTIIGITASTFEDDKNRFLNSGIDAFIAKPFREQELYDVLGRYAGVKFVTEVVGSVLHNSAAHPTLEKMSAEWLLKFRLALSRGNITHIRQLGEEAGEFDPLLSAYLLNLADLYDLDALEKLILPHYPA